MKFSAVLTSLILVVPLFAGEALAQRNKGAMEGKVATAAKVLVSTLVLQRMSLLPVLALQPMQRLPVLALQSMLRLPVLALPSMLRLPVPALQPTTTTVTPNVAHSRSEGHCDRFCQQWPRRTRCWSGRLADIHKQLHQFLSYPADLPITNGKQIKTGSCNPAPMGIIAATTNMPSSKFVSPKNGDDIAANTAFTIQMKINNLVTGNFVNAQSNYYSAPQQVDGSGTIVGHTHFTVQDVGSFTSTNPLDPNVFAFFKGVNGAAVNGVVSEQVANGLPAGVYRVCSMNTDANHTPALVAVAQHGSWMTAFTSALAVPVVTPIPSMVLVRVLALVTLLVLVTLQVLVLQVTELLCKWHCQGTPGSLQCGGR
ncbi:hypothetical protein BC826DRAFT_224428 [Russula brevipes]|nr:hypothetical protein BC826DRAFT_224428 [Russula brevipes]